MDRQPSILNVNLLYLVAFLALLVGGLLLPGLSLGRRVVINELAFLALPLVVFLLISRADLRETLRLRGISWPVAALSLLVGLGLWRFDWWLAAGINGALDYTIPLPPEALNLTVLDKVAMAAGTVVLAPIVEELFFRGVLQSAYERRGPFRAIAASTLLFVLIHQELAQSVALLPVTVALGYVAWRTRSVLPAMLVHVGNNGQAMVVSFLESGTLRRAGFTPSAVGALVGGLIAVAALWLLSRSTPRPDQEREVPQPSRSAGRWLAAHWPILPTVPIYVAVIALGVLVGVRPEALALGQPVELGSAPWDQDALWRYEVRNALDELVGEAECHLTREQAAFLLDCSMEQTAYQADAPTGFFQEGDVVQRQTVRWDADTLALEDLELEATFREGEDRVALDAWLEDGALSMRVAGAAEGERAFDRCYRIDENADVARPTGEPCGVDDAFLAGGGVLSPLMAGEWPWRFSALPFQLLYSREATLLWPYRSAEGIDGRAPLEQEVFVVVRTAEELLTPAGDFITWRVTVGDKYTAWYTVEPPHHLVAYDDDMVTWRLAGVE